MRGRLPPGLLCFLPCYALKMLAEINDNTLQHAAAYAVVTARHSWGRGNISLKEGGGGEGGIRDQSARQMSRCYGPSPMTELSS